jgi:hypothetical protein
MIDRAGLDWSGDPGDPTKAGSSKDLVFAIVHVREDDLDQVEHALASVRSDRGLPPNYAVKFKHAREAIRDRFFRAMVECPIQVNVLLVEKRLWPSSLYRTTRGADRINRCIAELIVKCADDLVGGQILLIDGKKDETPTLAMARQALRQAMTAQQRRSFSKIRMVSDEREGILQIADMFAGLIRSEGIESHRISGQRHKIKIV